MTNSQATFILLALGLLLVLFGGVVAITRKEIETKLKNSNLTPFNFEFVSALITVESSFNPYAFNPFSKAKGLFQMREIACKDVNCIYENLFNVDYAIICGLKFLNKLYFNYGNDTKQDVRKILVAYNSGIGTLQEVVAKYGINYLNYIPQETKNYLIKFEKELNKSGKTLDNIL